MTVKLLTECECEGIYESGTKNNTDHEGIDLGEIMLKNILVWRSEDYCPFYIEDRLSPGPSD